jgi:electron transfer flavoprotein alpha subunit
MRCWRDTGLAELFEFIGNVLWGESIPVSGGKPMAESVWVVVEYDDSIPQAVNSALALAGKLGEGKEIEIIPVVPVIKGNLQTADQLAAELASKGIKKMLWLELPQANYLSLTAELLLEAVIQGAEKYAPGVILFGATPLGREVAPRMAVRLGTGLVTNCVDLNWKGPARLFLTRPIYRGLAYCTMEVGRVTPVIATVNPGIKLTLKEKPGTNKMMQAKLAIQVDGKLLKTKVRRRLEAVASTVDLAEASKIVAGGRGAGAGGIKLIQELAEVMGASVGGTRVGVDEGWLPFERQIGQTGKIIAPDFYLACGISGAIHHTMGLKDSDYIISINTDKQAAIFNVSDVGVVGDMHEILPVITAKIKAWQRDKFRMLKKGAEVG